MLKKRAARELKDPQKGVESYFRLWKSCTNVELGRLRKVRMKRMIIKLKSNI